MKPQKILTLLFLFITTTLIAQNKSQIISGPWAGNVELRNATIWAEVSIDVKSVAVKFSAINPNNKATGLTSGIVKYKGELGKDFNPIKIELNNLKINTNYQYALLINDKPSPVLFLTSFTTKDLWQYRKPAPDFSFLTGSCAYFNEPEFDRPGKPYGADSSIFETMANTLAAFHIWLGDNWYTREVDYLTKWGLNYRASHDRALPVLQKFMASMPQYAIWDDHDYGPNDAGKSYILKEESRKIFMNYSLNPTYGEDGKGIYSMISYSDVDVFLTDDRYFRSEDEMPDSIDGKPNLDKNYLGKKQLDWLKNALTFSHATFKIIATGGQVLNPINPFEGMNHYTAEYNELINFIVTQQIKGVIFITGDRHHSEIIKIEKPNFYPLYDITISPYTAGVAKVRGAEISNPFRVPGSLVETQNFAKFKISGARNNRVLKVEFIGTKGDKLAEWTVNEKALTAGTKVSAE